MGKLWFCSKVLNLGSSTHICLTKVTSTSNWYLINMLVQLEKCDHPSLNMCGEGTYFKLKPIDDNIDLKENTYNFVEKSYKELILKI